eukprot:4084599-Lingulodinium_polyedra.AAC.1
MALRRCFRFSGAEFSFASSSRISFRAWMIWEAVAAYARPLLTVLRSLWTCPSVAYCGSFL